MVLEVMYQARKKLGLSLQMIANYVGVSVGHVGKIEHGWKAGSDGLIADIAALLRVDYRDIREEQREKNVLPVEQRPTVSVKPAYEFKAGKLYKFLVGGRHGEKISRERLRFIRDEGKHHVFQHPVGGWVTCFTDPQLCGAKIKEQSR